MPTSNPFKIEPLWTVKQLADRLNKSHQTIRNALHRARVTGVQPQDLPPVIYTGPRSPRWRPEDVERWLNERAQRIPSARPRGRKRGRPPLPEISARPRQ